MCSRNDIVCRVSSQTEGLPPPRPFRGRCERCDQLVDDYPLAWRQHEAEHVREVEAERHRRRERARREATERLRKLNRERSRERRLS